MDKAVLAANLARIRSQTGLSQLEVAEKAGISRQAYRSLEGGQAEPRTRTLMAIATALAVPVDELLRPVRQLRQVRFRADKKMVTRGQLLAEVARWLDDYCDLEAQLGETRRSPLSECGRASPEACAARARAAFGLGKDELIRDICGLLEDKGVKVFLPRVASEGFFGLSVGAEDGGPAVVVNTWERISVERWIFSAAHELGHLLMHLDAYDIEREDEDDVQEREADRFASHFLMPPHLFRKEWEEARGRPLLDRVFKLKQIFRVSYKSVLYRASEDASDTKIWGKFYAEYKRRYGRSLTKTAEPDPLRHADFGPAPVARGADEPERTKASAFMDDRLWRLVRRGVEDGVISVGRGSEILGLSTREMRQVVAGWVE